VNPPIEVGNGTFSTSGATGLKLDEVSYTAFYPASFSGESTKGMDWLPRYCVPPGLKIRLSN
jgi:hypothetical protein